MSSSIRTAKLIDGCTVSIAYDSQVKSACLAFDRQMYEIVDVTPDVCFIPLIMELTDELLVDILAWQFHVDFYDPRKPLEFKKQLVQDSIIWHKTKGTVALVQWVLDTYWPGGAIIEEWFQYMDPLPPPAPDPVPGWVFADNDWHDRYRFRISIDQLVIDPNDELEVLRMIDRYKPVSRWCEGIYRPKVSQCDIGWAGMALRFIDRTSEAPDYNPEHPEFPIVLPPEFNPADVVGLKAWWKADAIPAMADGSVITTWPDSSADGRAFQCQGTVTYEANERNGKPIVRYSAGGSTTPLAGMISGPAVSIFLVAKVNDIGTGAPMLNVGGNPANALQVYLPFTDGVVYFDLGDSAAPGRVSGPWGGNFTDYFAWSFIAGSGNMAIYRNGTLVASRVGAVNTFNPAGLNLQLCMVGGIYCNNDVAELLFYDAETSDADRQSIENYLKTEHGITP